MDASIVVPDLGGPPRAAVDRIWDVWHTERPRLIAPTLVWYEVANAVHQAVRDGRRHPEQAARTFSDTLTLPIETYCDAELHQRALALAGRFALPAPYDAHYLALAERFGAPLWTTDKRLAKAVGNSLPEVLLVD